MPLTICDADVRRELSGGEIIEEEQGLGALHDDVVHAHGDEVDADRVVDASVDGDLHLGADAIVGRNQDRVLEAGGLQVEEPAEPADLRVRPGPARRAHQGLDLVDHGIAGIDVDARLGIGQAVRLLLGRHGSPRVAVGSKAGGDGRQGILRRVSIVAPDGKADPGTFTE